MTLVATRHVLAHDLVIVTNEDYSHGDGNVVYRWNEKHKVGTRTNGHAGAKPSLSDIRAAIRQMEAA